jgi:hypothetical protein
MTLAFHIDVHPLYIFIFTFVLSLVRVVVVGVFRRRSELRRLSLQDERRRSFLEEFPADGLAPAPFPNCATQTQPNDDPITAVTGSEVVKNATTRRPTR